MIFLFAWSVIFIGQNGLPSASGECISNYDCRLKTHNKVCCAAYRLGRCFRDSCAGKRCWTHGDCGGESECCNYGTGRCTTFGCTECHSNNDCSRKQYCCKRQYGRNVCRRNCLGETCILDFDCGGTDEYCTSSNKCSNNRYCFTTRDCKNDGECCKYGKCVTTGCPTECLSIVNCISSTYCCKRRHINDNNVCLRSCVGVTCYLDSDCGGPGEYCTNNNICWKSGRSCSTDLNCNGNGECCISGKCANAGCPIKSDETSPVWVTPIIAICVILFVLFIGSGWSYCRCRDLSRRRRVADEPPNQGTAAVIALRETYTQSNPALPIYGSPPPPYYRHDSQPLQFPQP